MGTSEAQPGEGLERQPLCLCVSPQSSLESLPVFSLFGFLIRGSLIYSLILLPSLFFSDALQSHVFLSLAWPIIPRSYNTPLVYCPRRQENWITHTHTYTEPCSLFHCATTAGLSPIMPHWTHAHVNKLPSVCLSVHLLHLFMSLWSLFSLYYATLDLSSSSILMFSHSSLRSCCCAL